jgi:lipoate---protein ligase
MAAFPLDARRAQAIRRWQETPVVSKRTAVVDHLHHCLGVSVLAILVTARPGCRTLPCTSDHRMKLLDLTLPTPAENLACDEALLDWCEADGGEEVLRFWASPTHFVVVGYANKVANEVNVPVCEAHGIPILRRCSGGGTVVQGPGCLNYALILGVLADGPTRNIGAANQFVMERNRTAMESLLGRPAKACGHTDLATGGLKFSGNSQRRRRKFLLFHGTFLLNFDLALVGELLHMPAKQPDYRAGRAHETFITNLNLPADRVKVALETSWETSGRFSTSLESEITKLVEEKYSKPEWNRKH